MQTTSLSLALAGLLIGVLVGLTGMGGGSLLTPVLVIVFGMRPTAAVSSDLIVSAVVKPIGALIHGWRGTVRWDVVRTLSVGSIPGAVAGTVALHSFHALAPSEVVVQFVIAVALLAAATAMGVKTLFDLRGRSVTGGTAVRPAVTVVAGLAIGFLVAVTSVGSGSIAVVALLMLYPGLGPRALVGTDLAQAVPLALAAVVPRFLLGDAQSSLSLPLLGGSAVGVVIGALLSTRVSRSALRPLLTAALIGSGISLLTPGRISVPVVAATGCAVAIGLEVFGKMGPVAGRTAALGELRRS